jgi:hypothetical protein
MEDNGIQPDINVDWTPDQYLRGEDPQLARAVQEALKRVRD